MSADFGLGFAVSETCLQSLRPAAPALNLHVNHLFKLQPARQSCVLLPCVCVMVRTTEASPPPAMTISCAGAVQRETQFSCCCSVLLSMPGASAATVLPSPKPCSITAPPKATW